jgi:hypothetical protein
MTALARRALVASLDGGPPIHGTFGSDAEGPFRIALDDQGDLVLAFEADRATLAIDPRALGRHRWRAAWQLELEDADDRRALGVVSETSTVVIEDARRPSVALLRVQRRGLVRALDGEDVEVYLADVSGLRYTRQSTAQGGAGGDGPATLAPYAAATEPEAAPW